MITDAEMARAVEIFVQLHGGGEYPTLASPAMRHCLTYALMESPEFAGIWHRSDDVERDAITALVAEEFAEWARFRALIGTEYAR